MSYKPKAKQKPNAAPPTAQTPQPTAATSPIPSFDLMPDGAFIRESQLVQSRKRPNTPAPLPFSGTTLWRKVAAGQFPAPVKLSAGITAWRVGTVRQWLSTQAAG